MSTKAVPVEIVFESKKDNGEIFTDYFTVTQYKPFLALDIEDYFVSFISHLQYLWVSAV